MRRNDGPSSEGTGPVRVVERPVPNPLSLDPKPELSADLVCKGHDLLSVGDVECQTVNGKNLWKEMIDAHESAIEKATAKSAPKNHSHSEFDAIKSLISQKADKDHSHPEGPHSHELSSLNGTLPLAKVEKGEEIASLLTKELCPLQHSHPNVEKAIVALDSALKDLKAQLGKKLEEGHFLSLQKAQADAITAIKEELRKVEEKIPTIREEEVELIGIRRALVPFKCSARKIISVVAVDEQETPVKATVTCKGKEVKAGDTFPAYTVLTLSPENALVCIRFE